MYRFYKKEKEDFEYCFYVDTSKELTDSEEKILIQLLSDGFKGDTIQKDSSLKGTVVEIGPRLSFATAFSTNAVSVCRAAGLDTIERIERSRRQRLPKSIDRDAFISEHADRMTETVYEKPLEVFQTNEKPEKVYIVPLIEEGIDALKNINTDMGLGMDDWDVQFYYDLFVEDFKRNPTNVECFQLGQANSEHSRHWFFNGKLIIDGKEMSETLFDLVRAPLRANKNNSVIAFKDNSSSIVGNEILTILPNKPGTPSQLDREKVRYDLTLTAETHNFPTGVAPFAGAETGPGGRIRDGQATGSGSLIVAGTAGYCVGNLYIAGYELSWESTTYEYPDNLAAPLKILIEASDGASDYGNKFGEPLIQGFTRSFGLTLPNDERREWLKPIMFTGGVGQMDARHREKGTPEKGMLIIQIGGPAYRIGIGGGAASSMIQGQNAADLDFNAVQRGDAEMEQKMNRVIRACVEMGDDNPIISIHDQGAGGPCNVITEIIEPVGGTVDIRNITVGDTTLSVLEIWGAEYQERDALLIRPDRLTEFASMCEREKVRFEKLGEVTGDGRVIVVDSKDDSTPVDLELSKILGDMPQKEFVDKIEKKTHKAFEVPENTDFKELLENVLKLVSVGSKRFLTSKVDRSVTGLVVQQQCCGPLQLTVSDVAVVAQSHFSNSGAAIAIGEQPIKMTLDPQSGARMSVGEALTNLVSAKIQSLEHIKCSANWMLAAKLPGEGAALYEAAKAMSEIMTDLGMAVDGGKDSLSMAAKVGDEIVKGPNELTISVYADVPDIEKVLTPDIKHAGESQLWLIDIGNGNERLGGSALAQTFGSFGSEVPDVDADTLKQSFTAIQELIDKGLIVSGHDRSDGGLIATILEMAFSGNCGLDISVDTNNLVKFFFNEELGYVVEVDTKDIGVFKKVIAEHNLTDVVLPLGETTKEKKVIVSSCDKEILNEKMIDLRQVWEETSHQLDRLQRNVACAKSEKKNIYDALEPPYKISFAPEKTSEKILEAKEKIKVAIIREEGSNGDREMASAFYAAGFEPWDVSMSDLLSGSVTLDQFRGIVFVGGFSYADVLGSAKGWAASIRFNNTLKKMFDEFYERKDTFSLGVCNGCQLMSLLGWVPQGGAKDSEQPRFVQNDSEKFESRWTSVKIDKSPSIMLQGMEGSTLGVWVAHGEGKLEFEKDTLLQDAIKKNLTPILYVDDAGEPTEKYPFNPNGTPNGITALCSEDGRHLAMMPHPERAFLKWQWPWMPESMKQDLKASPWLRMFQNARTWCEENS